MLREHFAPTGLGRRGRAMTVDLALLTEFSCAVVRQDRHHGAGFIGTSGRDDDADLKARHAEAGIGGAEPAGSLEGTFRSRNREVQFSKAKVRRDTDSSVLK